MSHADIIRGALERLRYTVSADLADSSLAALAALLSERAQIREALDYWHRMHRIKLTDEGFESEETRREVSVRYAMDVAALAAAGPEQGATSG